MPTNARLIRLRQAVEDKGLSDMWDMILSIDYQAAQAADLMPETLEQFLDVIELLVRAFSYND
ncbi:hypothetical protein [Pannonibacter sp. SL95]|uniref:hypothetical protein n=1 Tax=Pannonibacter sp. SL95 TaxID=2995153 RepID=UPI00227444B1|nr:hypothetical protein [Pannonibacter sp. SL95]MCY1706063.1 hypothetical protein [Pannonibacter sp. SL95]